MNATVDEVEVLAERVRGVRVALFGRTLGNKYRAYARELTEESEEPLREAAKRTRLALTNAVFEDHVLAQLSLARLARAQEHAAMIFLALDLMNSMLMNPEMTPNHQYCVNDMAVARDNPVGMTLRCLEWLAG